MSTANLGSFCGAARTNVIIYFLVLSYFNLFIDFSLLVAFPSFQVIITVVNHLLSG